MDFYIEINHFNLKRTLFCGQAFRFAKIGENLFRGIVGNRVIKVRQEQNGITFIDIADNELDFWTKYFDIETDYKNLVKSFSLDKTLKIACDFAHGIRLLQQEPFETLISFIISQNNNIKRIGGIIERLCQNFGEKIDDDLFAFPTAERLASATVDELSVVRAGFRARYIIDAAAKVHTGFIDLNLLYNMNADEAKKELLKITGVGDKVADCVLLFAYRKTESVPKDVWIKRVMAEFYPDGLPECVGNNSGIAQQYLFEYIRNKNKTNT